MGLVLKSFGILFRNKFDSKQEPGQGCSNSVKGKNSRKIVAQENL